jgi:hypothetical protein
MCSMWDHDYNVNCKYDYDGDYEIEIQGKNKKFIPDMKNGHKYYPLPNGAEYIVRLNNNTDKRCNVILSIDGKEMGKWRINAYSGVSLERPTNSPRKFTFFREKSREAKMGGVKAGSYKNGLIEAKFIPESVSRFFNDRVMCDNLNNDCEFGPRYSGTENINQSFGIGSIRADSERNSYSSGATVLGRGSSQRFNDASYMKEDKKHSVTKTIRLVVDEKPCHHVSPYVPIDTYEPEDDFPSCHCECGGQQHNYKRLYKTCPCCRGKRKDRIPPRIEEFDPYDYGYSQMFN